MICLTAIVVFVIDCSGFTESWKGALGRWLGVMVGRVRPFDCSLCASWWANIVLLLCGRCFTLPFLAFAALLAALTPQVAQCINLVRYGLDTALHLIYKFFDKIWKQD